MKILSIAITGAVFGILAGGTFAAEPVGDQPFFKEKHPLGSLIVEASKYDDGHCGLQIARRINDYYHKTTSPISQLAWDWICIAATTKDTSVESYVAALMVASKLKIAADRADKASQIKLYRIAERWFRHAKAMPTDKTIGEQEGPWAKTTEILALCFMGGLLYNFKKYQSQFGDNDIAYLLDSYESMFGDTPLSIKMCLVHSLSPDDHSRRNGGNDPSGDTDAYRACGAPPKVRMYPLLGEENPFRSKTAVAKQARKFSVFSPLALLGQETTPTAAEHTKRGEVAE